jgi:hypothetical protein
MRTCTNDYELEIAGQLGNRRLVRRSLYSYLPSELPFLGSRNAGEVGTPNAERRAPNAS